MGKSNGEINAGFENGSVIDLVCICTMSLTWVVI